MNLKLRTYLLVGILLLALFARFLKIEYVPYANDADEMAYIFAGQSLLTKGIPISWTSFTNTASSPVDYPIEYSAVEPKPNVKFVAPWFDHMYFLPLMMGSWSLALGYDFPSVPPALLYRLPMLLVSVASLYLLFKISEKHFGTYAGFFSLILISFSPALIIIHRMVVAENLLNLFFLLTYYFYIEKKPLYFLVLSSFLAAATKVTGLAIIPVIAFLFVTEKQYKQAALYFLSSLGLSIGGYALYGYLIDWNVFVVTLSNQSYRLLGWSNPAFIFSHPGFHIYTLLDFSYYLIPALALGMVYLETSKAARQILLISITLFTLIWVTSAEQDMLGWYKVPLYSFLAISAGATIKNNKYFLSILLFIVTLVNNLGLVRYPETPLPDSYILRGVVSVAIGATVLYLFYTDKKDYKKYILGTLCVLYMAQGLYVANNFYAATCKDRICPIPLVTLKSTLQNLVP